MLALLVTTAVSCYASFVLTLFQLYKCYYDCSFTSFACFFFLYRKKKKEKERKRLEEQAMALEDQAMTSQNENGTKKVYVDKRTPAQMSFDKIQEKRVFITFYICHLFFFFSAVYKY